MTGPKVNVQKVGSWKKAAQTMPRLAAAYAQAEETAVHQEALLFQKKVGDAFKSSGVSNGTAWEGNSPSTIRRKGSSKPLIDTGDLRGSINVQKVGRAEFFVGVPSAARNKDGKSLVQIGEVHENGKVIVIKVTKAMHGFVMAEMAKLGGASGPRKSANVGGSFRPGSILTIKIPQRSFLQATMDAHFKPGKSEGRIKRRISQQMRAQFGNVVQVR